jgi:site-specific DNA-methyltransferase (adenine-specific)
MGGEKADVVYADPPYGIEAVNITTKKVGGGGATKFKGTDGASNWVEAKEYSPIVGDETTDTAKTFYELMTGLKHKNIILWGGNYYSNFLPISRCWFVWDKEMTGNFSQAEMAWTSFDTGGIRVFKYLWNGLSREGSRYLEGVKRMHPTQKPVGLAMMIFQRFDLLKTIFDGFLGSGTTMVAAHQLNRKCYGMEIDPKYCQVIIDRMRKLDPAIEIKRL